MIKDLVQIGETSVRKKSKNIPKKDIQTKKTQQIIQDLTDTMRATNLVGIAAPQIGINLNIFLTEPRKTKYRKRVQADQLRVYINPKIIRSAKKQTILVEGCGSLVRAQLHGPVRRPSKVTVEYSNENSIREVLEADGLLAKIIQHEFDHLQGVIFIDKILDTKKLFYKKLTQ